MNMRIVVKGDGVCGDGILYGSKIKVTFDIPKIKRVGELVNMGLSLTPSNCTFPHYYKQWYRQFTIPGGRKKRVFSLTVPTKEKSYEEFISLLFGIDSEGLLVFSSNPSVPLISELRSEPKPYIIEIKYDLDENYEGIFERLKEWESRSR